MYEKSTSRHIVSQQMTSVRFARLPLIPAMSGCPSLWEQRAKDEQMWQPRKTWTTTPTSPVPISSPNINGCCISHVVFLGDFSQTWVGGGTVSQIKITNSGRTKIHLLCSQISQKPCSSSIFLWHFLWMKFRIFVFKQLDFKVWNEELFVITQL